LRICCEMDLKFVFAVAARTGVEPEYLPTCKKGRTLCTAILYGQDRFSDHVRSK
jgi:hypothetical protein